MPPLRGMRGKFFGERKPVMPFEPALVPPNRLVSTRKGRSQMRKAAVQIGCAGRFANEMTGAADLISAAPSSIPAIRRQNRIDLRFCIGLSLRNSFRAVSDAFSVDELHIRHTEEREHGFKKRHLAV